MSEEGHLLAGRYRFKTQIGSGAMGVVWQAHDEILHRVVAIKQVILPAKLEPGEAEEARQRAMREGRIAARLQHPNAIAVYDVTEDEGQPCLVMEYLPSRSLAAVIYENGPLPPREVARIGAQVASALSAAHDAGIVHRDIKPGNILLGDNGTVKITDFGISRAKGDVTVTKTGMLAGTPAYLSPDVAIGREPSPASDVFSLGSTLYAAVEGQPPFGLDENTLALLHAVAAGRVRPPRQAGPLTTPLMQLLRASPEERPTMPQVGELLSAVVSGQGNTSSPPAGFAAPTYQQTAATQAMGEHAGARSPGSNPNLRSNPATRFDARPGTSPVGGTRVGGSPMGPPTNTAARPVAAPAQGGRNPAARQSRKKAVITVLAILAAAALGVGGAIYYFGQPAASSTQTVAPPPATSTPDTPTSNEGGEPIGYSEAGQLVIDYYSEMVPKNLDQGWATLTPRAQREFGGRAAYDGFWGHFVNTSARAAMVTKKDPDGSLDVTCQVAYVAKDGKHKTEKSTLHVVRSGGKLMIDSKGDARLP